jgi:GNAT superfamily N-acetyltransferase
MTPRLAEPPDFSGFQALFRTLDPHAPVPDRVRWERDFMSRTLVIDGPTGLLAYAYFDAFDEAAYVQQLVVSPEVRNTGMGRALMHAVARHLRSRGLRYWDLNVDLENTAAVRLYESLGMSPVGETTSLRFSWTLVDQLPVPSSNVLSRGVEPTEDPSLEMGFRLRHGSLDVARRKVGRHIIALFEGGTPVGLAVFAPALPSTYPLRIARAELAAPLLRSLREVADLSLDHTLVAIDDDASLVRRLVEHGAVAYLTAARYSGTLRA